jgi:hypothetical protein
MKEASWDDLQLFFHVATGGGLSAAAARTGLMRRRSAGACWRSNG